MNATLLYHQDRLRQPRVVLLRCNHAPAIGAKRAPAIGLPGALMSSRRSLVPNALLITLPYLLALMAVGGLVGRQMAPATLGEPYRR
jgi:ABC-type uncharacterized transport system permease subunit